MTGGVLQRSKLGFLRPVQQPGSYWDRSSELPLVGLEPTGGVLQKIDFDHVTFIKVKGQI